MADVFVASRTHELRVFTGSAEDAQEFAAGLVEQLRDQGPVSRNPYVSMPSLWTPEGWREAKNDSASRFRQGITSCAWYGPAGLEIRIEDARTGVTPEACLRCEGMLTEPGSEDYDPAVHMHNPTTGEPCHACNGTGNAPGVSAEGDGQ